MFASQVCESNAAFALKFVMITVWLKFDQKFWLNECWFFELVSMDLGEKSCSLPFNNKIWLSCFLFSSLKNERCVANLKMCICGIKYELRLMNTRQVNLIHGNHIGMEILFLIDMNTFICRKKLNSPELSLYW